MYSHTNIGESDFLKSVGLVLRSDNGTYQMTSVGNISVWPGKAIGCTKHCFETSDLPVTIISDGPPPDGTPVVVVHTLSTFVTALQSILTGILLTAVVIGLIINIAFRKRK